METGEVSRSKLVQPSCKRIVERHNDMLRETLISVEVQDTRAFWCCASKWGVKAVRAGDGETGSFGVNERR